MTYVKINGNLYPATINGSLKDRLWNDRESKAITLEMDYAAAAALFVDGLAWSIVMDIEQEQEDGSVIIAQKEYDNSDYDVAGPITDNRNGTVTVKMGKATAQELLAVLTGEVQYLYLLNQTVLDLIALRMVSYIGFQYLHLLIS